MPSITSVKVGKVKAKVTILSTPFEEASLFHDLIENEEKYYMFSRYKTNIYDAVIDGLDVDIDILKDLFDADSWSSMYECQFIDDEKSFFPISLIKSCVDYNFSYGTPGKDKILFSGFDIGRKRDLSVLTALQQNNSKYDLILMDIFTKAPFDTQYSSIKDFLTNYPKAYLNIDMTGLGMNLAEKITTNFYNQSEGVYFTQSSKEMMVLNLKKMFEDKMIRIPNDSVLISDIHSIKRKAGVKRFIYDSDRNSAGHSDRFWSLALAVRKLDLLETGRTSSNGGGAMIFG